MQRCGRLLDEMIADQYHECFETFTGKVLSELCQQAKEFDNKNDRIASKSVSVCALEDGYVLCLGYKETTPEKDYPVNFQIVNIGEVPPETLNDAVEAASALIESEVICHALYYETVERSFVIVFLVHA